MKVDSVGSSSNIKVEDPTVSVAVALLVGVVTVLLIFYLFKRRRRFGRGESGVGTVC